MKSMMGLMKELTQNGSQSHSGYFIVQDTRFYYNLNSGRGIGTAEETTVHNDNQCGFEKNIVSISAWPGRFMSVNDGTL